MRRATKQTMVFVLILAVALFLAVSGSAWASTFAVVNTNDSGPGSLRQAIVDANTRPGSDLITFAPGLGGAIDLQRALPALRGQVEVRGPGSNKLAVRRSPAPGTPEFGVLSTGRDATVTVSGLKVSNGVAGEKDFGTGVLYSLGGGIYNEEGADLTLRSVVVSRNRAHDNGGGVYSGRGSKLTVVGSTFTDNSTYYSGGGIDISRNGELRVSGSTFARNRTVYSGGGINTYSEATVSGSTFSNNSAPREVGGGIAAWGDTMNVRESIFSGNSAIGGGAIYSDFYDFSSSYTVVNSTFVGNRANRGGGALLGGTFVVGSTFSGNTAGGSGGAVHGPLRMVVNSTFWNNTAQNGGAIYSVQDHDAVIDELLVSNSTISNNTSREWGGGIYTSRHEYAFVRLKGTIVARNEAQGEGPDVSGRFESGGYNLLSDTAGAQGFGPTDITNRGAGLDPEGLQDNGGPTKTIALTGSSPALDVLPGDVCPPPATDQRGTPRPQDGDGDGSARCDIGAFELRSP